MKKIEYSTRSSSHRFSGFLKKSTDHGINQIVHPRYLNQAIRSCFWLHNVWQFVTQWISDWHWGNRKKINIAIIKQFLLIIFLYLFTYFLLFTYRFYLLLQPFIILLQLKPLLYLGFPTYFHQDPINPCLVFRWPTSITSIVQKNKWLHRYNIQICPSF